MKYLLVFTKQAQKDAKKLISPVKFSKKASRDFNANDTAFIIFTTPSTKVCRRFLRRLGRLERLFQLRLS